MTTLIRRKLAFAVLLALSGTVLLWPRASEAGQVRIASEGTYRPFSYLTPDGQLTGFDVEYIQSVCKAAGLDCVMVTMDYDGMVAALKEKKIDAIASGMTITEKRKKTLAFTDRYRTSGKRFISCAPGKFPKVGPEDLKGATVGTQGETTSGDYLKAVYQASEVRLYKSMDEAFADLSAGRLDLALSQEASGYDFVNSTAGKGCAMVGERLEDPKYFGEGVGIALRQSDTDLLAALNEGIRKVRADGTFKTLNAKYFPFSIE